MSVQDEVTRVLAIRHGETAWNAATRIQGQLDVPLNDVGRRQAQRLGQALCGERIEAIYASDLQRAFETAQALGTQCGTSVITDQGLRERGFGEFEGYTWQEIETRWPVDSERWRRRDLDFAPGGGESLRTFYARCTDAATRLAAAHAGQTIALVAHGGVMDCLYRAASRIDLQAPRSWQLVNAGINRLLYTHSGFTVIGWSDTGHLNDMPQDEPVEQTRKA